MSIPRPNGRGSFDRITVPCGKCYACRSNKRSDWSFRLYQEQKHSVSSYFVTLTYDTGLVPVMDNYGLYLRLLECFDIVGVDSYDEFDIQYSFDLMLYKRDVQLYFKRLRKYCKSDFRYYLVGEYGKNFGRPHYHMLIFGISPEDYHWITDAWRLYYGQDKDNNPLFHPLGFVHIGTVTKGSIHYVNKYMVKRVYRPKRVPEFSMMSKGIGKKYLENSRWHRGNSYFHVISEAKYKQRLPRYYRDKIFSKNEYKLLKYRKEVNEKVSEEFEKLLRHHEKLSENYFVAEMMYKIHLENKSNTNFKLEKL